MEFACYAGDRWTELGYLVDKETSVIRGLLFNGALFGGVGQPLEVVQEHHCVIGRIAFIVDGEYDRDGLLSIHYGDLGG